MDPLELLRLEAETIWGCTDGGLGCNTVNATAISFDGRSLLIPGATQLTPEGAITASVSRTWTLKPTPPNGTPAGLQLVTEAAGLQPPHGWTDEQWMKLMSGGHGPWAAIADHGQVVSLAHCARLSWRAAEVGVQTEEGQRGRGLAVIAVGAWTGQVTERGLVAFYSADEDNIASHRVAAKCRATPLGRLIQIALSAVGA